jgi:ABC-2 type transport system ATP-binding protein
MHLVDVIETQNLHKAYGALEVLHGINLKVPGGALYGFLGPNGAGKTTAVRILLGLLRRDAGEALILGRDCWREGATLRAEIGHLPGDIRWYDRLTGAATLRFFDKARRRDSRGEAGRLAECFELDLTRRVRGYSRGMKQKLGLIQALMHKPKLLILDEPTTSLDPLMQQRVLAELRAVADSGRTVLFSSHSLSEVQQLCDWVGILRSGRLIEQSEMAVLRERALRRVEIVLNGAIQGVPPAGLHIDERASQRLVGSWTGPIPGLIAWLAGQPVVDCIIAPPDLDDLFRAYYADDTDAKGEAS